RMTELTAAVGREQLKKLPAIVAERVRIAEAIKKVLNPEKFGDRYFKIPEDRSGCTHSYYTVPVFADKLARDYDWSAKRITVSRGYHGNLLIMPISIKWTTTERLKELIDTETYRSLGSLCMIEVCSWDITDDDIKKWEKQIWG